MSKLEVKMTKNKEIIEKLKITQEIVEEAKLSREYKQVAFQNVFNYLTYKTDSVREPIKIDTQTQIESQKTLTAKTFAGFLRNTNSKSHANKVLAASYYLLKTKSSIMFTKEDIEKEYKAAFLPKSKNTNAEINGLIQRGLIMPADEKVEGKKCYSITQDGITYVETELIKNE